jgi:hypothetical protein
MADRGNLFENPHVATYGIFSASLRLCGKIRPLKPATFRLIAGAASGASKIFSASF